MQTRAYARLDVKAVDEERREITGIATTPTTDRMGDIVEPKGAEFSLPVPLLWQHNRLQPIGQVLSAKVTSAGIEIRAKLAKIDGPPQLAARLEEAWQSIKTGLVRGLSIGFSPKEHSEMENGGYRFTKWDWFELSAVTIPANADASIQSIKSIDNDLLAASGNEEQTDIDNPPAIKPVGASTTKSIKSIRRQRYSKMNIDEQIKDFEATRAAKSARMSEIMEKAGEEGRTLEADETEEYDDLKAEVKAADDHLKRLHDLQEMNKAKAKPVEDVSGMASARLPATAKIKENLAPGIEFARYVMCLGAAKGDLSTASAIAQKRFPHSERINITLKEAVAAGTTTDATWALPLVEYNQFAGDFTEYLRPMTIIGKFGTGGIPALRSIPFNVHVRGQTSGGAGYWVGQGLPKPLTSFDYNDVYMGYAKVANIAVLTEELMRFSNPSAEALVRDSLAQALIARIDTDFVDPDKAEVSNVSPASITNGVSAIISSGTDADAVRTDVAAAMATFIAANITPAAGVWIMSATTALNLSLMRNALGQKEFPDITMMGGTFEGLPVITSEYVAADSNGGFLILANASDIWLADDGNVVVDASREASLQMADDPTNDSATPTATTMVSMFQTNSVAIRAERWINWKKRRSSAVAVVAHVNYAA